jgi:hypothetical protein
MSCQLPCGGVFVLLLYSDASGGIYFIRRQSNGVTNTRLRFATFCSSNRVTLHKTAITCVCVCVCVCVYVYHYVHVHACMHVC